MTRLLLLSLLAAGCHFRVGGVEVVFDQGVILDGGGDGGAIDASLDMAESIDASFDIGNSVD